MILRKSFVRSQWKRGSNSLSVCCLAHILLLHQALRELAKNITLNTQIPRLFHVKEETCSPIKHMLWAKCTLCVAAMTIHLFIPREGKYCVIFSYVVRKEHWYSQFFINCACLDSWFSVVLGIAREQLPQQYFSQLTVCVIKKKRSTMVCHCWKCLLSLLYSGHIILCGMIPKRRVLLFSELPSALLLSFISARLSLFWSFTQATRLCIKESVWE